MKFNEENHLLAVYSADLPMSVPTFFLPSGLEAMAHENAQHHLPEYGFQDSKQLMAVATEAVALFFSNDYAQLTEPYLNAPSLLLKTAQDQAIEILTPPTYINVAELTAAMPEAASRNVHMLVAQCKSKDFAVTLVTNALTGPLSLPSPFSANLAYCQESYEVPLDLNCLRFCDGDQSFFLIQLLSSADALYFPQKNLLLSFAHINATHIRRLQEKLLWHFAPSVIYANSVNAFAGIIASHSRPSHFYYDVWPALYEIAQQQALMEQIPTVIMRRDHDFTDFGALFDYRRSQVLDSQAIDHLAINENKWFVHAGRQQHLSDGLAYETADKYLVEKALQTPTAEALEKAAQIAGCYPVVWIGVEGQKRSWLEQIEGYAYLINELADKFPNLGIIFDGWTMPHTPSAASRHEADTDHYVADKICTMLDADVKHVSVIGETSNTKLVVGNLADFFIGSFSTGSIHISRFLGKPGFCHLSKRFSEVALRHAMHIHPNPWVFLLPRKQVSDHDLTGEEVRHDYLSYSIKKRDFYHFIDKHLPTVLNGTANFPPRLFIEPSYCVTYDLRIHLKMATHSRFLNVGAGEDKIQALAHYPRAYLQKQVIYGTFPFGSDKLAQIHADYLIWLRHPLPRVCFHANELRLAAELKGQKLSISDIFKMGHKVLDNYFTRMLSGNFAAPFGKCTEAMLLAAISNLKSRFIFIGINEQASASYDWLCTLMDWDRSYFSDTHPLRYELNDDEFSDAELSLAKAMNSFDFRLYEVALDIFKNRLKHLSTDPTNTSNSF